MANKIEIADIILWGKTIGAIAWDEDKHIGAFEYNKEFQSSGIEPSPITMPLGSAIYSFPELSPESYHGLPGMLADALPDKFGNLLIDQWLAQQGRTSDSFSPIERLCYMGSRGMGALEFKPTLTKGRGESVSLEIDALITLANEALAQKGTLNVSLDAAHDKKEAMNDIIRVGTSAGGARAKAVIAWNKETKEMRSGQVEAPKGFSYWLIKFDGVSGNRDKEIADPLGYGKVEYAYSLMAQAAGITMSPCELFEENGRSHFITKRFDRSDNDEKYHMQTLCGLAHYDFNRAGAYSYEQAFDIMRRLELSMSDIQQQFIRMVFNVVARNQDDHTKNIAFLMNKQGQWSLSPAYDINFSYNPDGAWTSQHQMSVNGKRDHFKRDDLISVANKSNISTRVANRLIEEVKDTVAQWPQWAQKAKVTKSWIEQIASCHRLDL